jgi:hypothetical protein
VIRVTRLMEYTFATIEQAVAHVEAFEVPANGVKSFGGRSAQPGGITIRSAIIGPVFGEDADAIHTAVAASESEPVAAPGMAKMILFKTNGKYYTEEEWAIPADAIVPYDMVRSPDFRRISGGPVLVVSQDPWGYPHLLLPGGEV